MKHERFGGAGEQPQSALRCILCTDPSNAEMLYGSALSDHCGQEHRLLTFAHPLTALLAARDMMSGGAKSSRTTGRAVLHLGSVTTMPDGSIAGGDVTLARRLWEEEPPGQIQATEAFAAQIRSHIPRDIVLNDLGERTFPNLAYPLRLFEVAPRTGGTMPEQRRVRVLLAEDEALLRRTLAQLLALEPDVELLADVADGLRAVEEAVRTRPDVVLTDIEMPGMDGIEATRRIREALPETEVVILTKFGDDERVFAGLKAGAIGYLLKDGSLEEIHAAIVRAHRHEAYLSPSLVTRVLGEFNRLSKSATETRQLFASLSRREVEVLELLAQGLRNRVIAERLFLSEKTVKNHISSILAKLEVNDRTEAALLAQRQGWIPPR
jgi:DNA-binding NarL/FixJ family response regulator